MFVGSQVRQSGLTFYYQKTGEDDEQHSEPSKKRRQLSDPKAMALEVVYRLNHAQDWQAERLP